MVTPSTNVSLPLISSAAGIGRQLSWPVLAHSGELHGQPTQSTASEDNDASNDETLEQQTLDPSTHEVALPPSETLADNPLINTGGSPTGLGESLFILIIILPWLLTVLRKQVHS